MDSASIYSRKDYGGEHVNLTLNQWNDSEKYEVNAKFTVYEITRLVESLTKILDEIKADQVKNG